MGIILVVVLLFLSCWVVKVKRRQDQEKVPGGTLRQQQFMAPVIKNLFKKFFIKKIRVLEEQNRCLQKALDLTAL